MFSSGAAGRFQDSFRCHSVSLLAAEQQRDPNLLEYSDKIILPPSCLEKLAQLEIQYPMMFELINTRDAKRRIHCGVLEFIAQEGMAFLPYWMMENLRLNEGDIIHLRSATIQKGSYVKLQPQTTDFIKISNPKAVLEQSLRSFSALTKGETFRILYNNRKYDIGVVDVRPQSGSFPSGQPHAVCIIETDLDLDFEAPADYVEPIRVPPNASPLAASPLQQGLVSAALPPPSLDHDSSDDEAAQPTFGGEGFRLDGKPIKPMKNVTPTLSGAGGSHARADMRLGASSGLPAGELGAAAPAAASSIGLGPGITVSAGKSAPAGEDYWANLSGGNKLG